MRYFIGFILTLGLIFLVVFLLFRGGDNPKKVTVKSLKSYATSSAKVRLTIDGPVNATSEHQQAKITVDKDNVTYEQFKGYSGAVVRTQNFANDGDAYSAFLSALGRAGFTKGNDDPALKDESGYCSQGSRYVFELTQDGENIKRYWGTSCGKTKTYLGAQSLTLSLFKAQVPGYNDLAKGLDL